DAIEADKPYSAAEKTVMKLGVDVLPKFRRDATDRNRTSPFAFTGNKFEFRMLGSSNSIACANIMLNAAVAESLKHFADRLEGADDFEETLHGLIRDVVRAHRRILFNGNGYDDAWIKEATEVRGLPNYRTTPDCFPELLSEKNVTMLTSHGVFTVEELKSRYEIMLENYCKTVLIEANTMIDMTRRQILPAVEKYSAALAAQAAAKKAVSAGIACKYEIKTAEKLSALADEIEDRVDELEEAAGAARTIEEIGPQSFAIRDTVLTAMGALRACCDEAETVTAAEAWPLPTYGELLFSVN
ncbi:MAG: glutamine synthetase type III, partial [Clostridiales bacterium]|nr:glutamine synthetase type III [Clostridiales bacterium]